MTSRRLSDSNNSLLAEYFACKPQAGVSPHVKWMLVALASMLLPIGAKAQPGTVNGKAVARVEQLIRKGLQDWETPGLIIAIVKDDKVVLTAGYGVRELGKPGKPDAHTRFPIGSTTKAFAAAEIAGLVDEGRLDWDDRVTKYLPWFELSDPWVTHEVRIRDILSHRVGPTLTTEGSLYSAASSSEDAVRRVRFLKPAFPFRSTYGYSNTMFTTAGLVAEAVSGMTWDAYLAQKIWTPLHMTETTANVAEVRGIENRVTGHMRVNGRLRPDLAGAFDSESFGKYGPTGAITSTATDMAQWLRLHLGEGTVDGRTIISREVFRRLHTPHSPIRGGPKQYAYWFTDLDAADLKSRDWSYALGWVVNDYRDRKMVWHGGTISNVRTVVAFLPEEHLGVYIGANALTLFPFALALSTFDTFLGKADTDWMTVFAEQVRKQKADGEAKEQALAAARIQNTQPSVPLARYAGRYQDNGAFGPIEVQAESGQLEVKLGTDRAVLEHWHHDVFRIRWLDSADAPSTFATFTLDPAGVPYRVELGDVGDFRRADAKSP